MKRWYLGAASLVAATSAAGAAWGQYSGYHYGPHMNWGSGWHGWFFGPVMMILFIAVIVVLAVVLVRRFGGFGHGGQRYAPPERDPLDILKERFAKGEIDKDDYEDRRRALLSE